MLSVSFVVHCVSDLKAKLSGLSVEQLIREHCHIDGDDLINYEGICPLM